MTCFYLFNQIHLFTFAKLGWKYPALYTYGAHTDVISHGKLKLFMNSCTVKAPVFGTLNSAISNFQSWFVRTVMEVLKYCWMQETRNMQCNYNSFIQMINFHGLFRNALRCRKTGACRILVPLRYIFMMNVCGVSISGYFTHLNSYQSLQCISHMSYNYTAWWYYT